MTISYRRPNLLLVSLTVLLAVTLAACANSVVLGQVYSGFGTQTAKRFKSYATFNADQEALIDRRIAHFHSWHRQQQLPLYADFLMTVVADVQNSPSLDFNTADKWWNTVQLFSREMRACNPFNASSDFLSSLTDRQVAQVAKRLDSDLKKRVSKYQKEMPEQRNARRVKEISKWSSRGGAGFNERQKQRLRETLASQVSLGKQRFALRRQWTEQFIAMLDGRGQPDFAAPMITHIDNTWSLTKRAFPQQWATNEKLWKTFIRDFVNLQTAGQRQRLLDRLTKTASSLQKMSKKNPPVDPVCFRVENTG